MDAAIARLDGVDERIPTRGRMPTFGAFWSTRTEPRRSTFLSLMVRLAGPGQDENRPKWGNSTPLVRAKAQKKGEVREDRRAPPAAPGEALVAAQPPDVDAYRLIRGL